MLALGPGTFPGEKRNWMSHTGWAGREYGALEGQVRRFQLDVTGERFDGVNLNGCTLSFPVPRVLGRELRVDVSGVVLQPRGGTRLNELSELMGSAIEKTGLFVAGYSELILRAPERVELSVALYQPDNAKEWLTREGGGPVELRKSWGNSVSPEAFEYNLGGVLAWPLGQCELDVWARGMVSLILDIKLCVPATVVFESGRQHHPSERRSKEGDHPETPRTP